MREGALSSAKLFATAADAVADIPDGSTLMVAGHRGVGAPDGLVRALLDRNVSGLTCICGPWEDGGSGIYDTSMLAARGRVRRLIVGASVDADGGGPALDLLRSGGVEVETVPPDRLAERVRAAGAGLGGVLLPVEGLPSPGRPETRTIQGVAYALEMPLSADFALLRARAADTLGNLVYRGAQRNWNPVMAAAARITIAEVDEVVPPGELDPELVITPGVYVDRIVPIGGGRVAHGS